MEQGIENYTIPQLISLLKTSFLHKDFKNVEQILLLREQNLKFEIEQAQLKMKSEKLKSTELEKHVNDLKQRLVTRLNECEKLSLEVEKKENEVEIWKRKYEELAPRVDKLEQETLGLVRMESQLSGMNQKGSNNCECVREVEGKGDLSKLKRESNGGGRRNSFVLRNNEKMINFDGPVDVKTASDGSFHGVNEQDTGPPSVNLLSKPTLNNKEEKERSFSKLGEDLTTYDDIIEIDDSDDEMELIQEPSKKIRGLDKNVDPNDSDHVADNGIAKLLRILQRQK